MLLAIACPRKHRDPCWTSSVSIILYEYECKVKSVNEDLMNKYKDLEDSISVAV